MSVFCAHCRKRLILEDYNVKCYQAVAGYATCGDVIVHKQGRVAAPIQAANLTVKGTVQGEVRVRGRVDIASTGSISGKIAAPSITVSDGARLDAYCVIRPEPVDTNVKSAGVITKQDEDDTKPLSKIRAAAAASIPAKKPATTTTSKSPASATKSASTTPAKKTAKKKTVKKTTKKKTTTKAAAKPATEEPPVIKSISTRRRSATPSTSKK